MDPAYDYGKERRREIFRFASNSCRARSLGSQLLTGFTTSCRRGTAAARNLGQARGGQASTLIRQNVECYGSLRGVSNCGRQSVVVRHGVISTRCSNAEISNHFQANAAEYENSSAGDGELPKASRRFCQIFLERSKDYACLPFASWTSRADAHWTGEAPPNCGGDNSCSARHGGPKCELSGGPLLTTMDRERFDGR